MLDQGPGIDQESGTDAFFETVISEIADFLAELDEIARDHRLHSRFTLNHSRFDVRSGVIKFDRHETLLRALLQVFEHALISWVVGNHQHKLVGSLHDLPLFLDREHTPIITEGMDDDGRILPGFDHLIEIHDGSLFHSDRQRPVHPDRLLSLEEIPTN